MSKEGFKPTDNTDKQAEVTLDLTKYRPGQHPRTHRPSGLTHVEHRIMKDTLKSVRQAEDIQHKVAREARNTKPLVIDLWENFALPTAKTITRRLNRN